MEYRTDTILYKRNPQGIPIKLDNHPKDKYQYQLECKYCNEKEDKEVRNGLGYESVLLPVKPVADHQSQTQYDPAQNKKLEKFVIYFYHTPQWMNNNHQQN